MSKIFKKIAAATIAAVMTTTMAVSANATSAECQHAVATKSRTGFANHYNTAHTIKVYGSNGASREERCEIGGNIYFCSYVCTACHKIVASAGTETEETHFNPLCSKY